MTMHSDENRLAGIKGILFDLDGVLHIGSRAVEGAVEAVQMVKRNGFTCRFVTNTSTLSLASLHEKMRSLGFSLAADEIISAPQAAVIYLRQQQRPVCRLVLAEDVKRDFSEFACSDTADHIIVGDIGDAWSYELLNGLFNRLMDGARLIAIHKNRFWQTERGLQMDIGGFIAALEYASGQAAMIIGKPSADFFSMALLNMGLKASEVAIIGDDIDADVGGGQQAGLYGILVKTGKYRPSYAEGSAIKPDLVLDSVRDLPGALDL